MLSAKLLQPRETGQIEVTVATESLSAKITKSVTVTTNDPRQPQVTLFVTADVEPEFTLSERQVYFGTVPKGKEVTKELFITIHPERSVKILSAESSDPNVTVKLEPLPDTKGKRLKLIAIQKADTKEGYHFGALSLRTSSPHTPEIKISVRGMVTATQNN